MNIVYQYRNKINGKLYIGRTSQTISKRANGTSLTGYKDCTKFWNAICKYGPENFELQILFDGLSFEDSVAKEAELIAKHHTDDDKYGYNILAQEPGCGKMDEATKQKIGAANKGKQGWNKGQHWSDEVKEKIRNSNKGRQWSDEHLKHIREYNASRKGKPGRKLSDDEKKRLGDSSKIEVVINETGQVFDSMTSLANFLGVNISNLSRAISLQRKYKGFTYSKRT